MKLNRQTRSCRQYGVAGLAALAAMITIMVWEPLAARSAGFDDCVTFSLESEGSYILGPDDSKQLARKFAVFRAHRIAAEKAADTFSQQRLIQFVDRDKNELVALVADALSSRHVKERWQTEGPAPVCTVRRIATVHLSDFIDAQLTSIRLASQVDSQGYRDEMEPPLPQSLRPGQALAKAYWLIHNHEHRRAIIYLDRLTRRYPHWREAYEIKAMALGRQNQFIAMQEALQQACALGSTEACMEVNRNSSNGSSK